MHPRHSLPFLLLVVMSGVALGQSDSLRRDSGASCWRGKPAPACHTFWITEMSVEYPFLSTTTTYTDNYGSFTQTFTRRDVSPQLLWTIGPMWNTSPNRALGMTVSYGIVHDGGRVALEGRRRYWSDAKSSFDLTAGLVHMDLPPLAGGVANSGYGLTASAYALGGDVIHVNARADLVSAGNRVHAGASVGAGFGSLGAAGATIALGALVVANLGTLCAEFAGVAAGFDLLGGVSRYVSVPLAALGVSLLVLRGSFRIAQDSRVHEIPLAVRTLGYVIEVRDLRVEAVGPGEAVAEEHLARLAVEWAADTLESALPGVLQYPVVEEEPTHAAEAMAAPSRERHMPGTTRVTAPSPSRRIGQSFRCAPHGVPIASGRNRSADRE